MPEGRRFRRRPGVNRLLRKACSSPKLRKRRSRTRLSPEPLPLSRQWRKSPRPIADDRIGREVPGGECYHAVCIGAFERLCDPAVRDVCDIEIVWVCSFGRRVRQGDGDGPVPEGGVGAEADCIDSSVSDEALQRIAHVFSSDRTNGQLCSSVPEVPQSSIVEHDGDSVSD